MRMNRSAPHACVVPVLTVSERAAVAWYAKVFGFVEHVQIGEGHRAQLGLPGGGELVVAEVRPGRRAPAEGRSHQIQFAALLIEKTAEQLSEAEAKDLVRPKRRASR